MKNDEAAWGSRAGDNEGFDNVPHNDVPHNDESKGDAKFTLDDINAELDNLMSKKNSSAMEPEVVNVPMEAVSEADQEDGRLRDGTVVKIR